MPIQILPEYGLGAVGGVCFVCKSSRRKDLNEQIVDFWVDVEELRWPTTSDIPGVTAELASGQLQICSTCVEEAARALGMEDAGRVSVLRSDLAAARMAAGLATDRQKAAEVALTAAAKYRVARDA